MTLDPLPFVDLPAAGRTFAATRRVRWGDTDRTGRLRLDAVARHLQDVANDDTRDAGLDPAEPWVVRRTALRVDRAPTTGELVTATTWSGGHGRRWAERRTSLVGDGGGRVEAAALWVHIDAASGLPARLGDRFHEIYDEAAGGRSVGARLRLPGPPADAEARPWPLRRTDLDGLGHVNNAATWEPVADALDRLGLRPTYAELEYGDAIGPDDEVTLRWHRQDAGERAVLGVWLTVDGQVRARAHVVATTA